MNALRSGEDKSLSFLAKLPCREFDCIVRALQSRHYGNGEIVFSEGNPCAGMYIVKTGRVKLIRAGKDKEQLLDIAGEGDPLDLVPLLDGGPHTCTAKARGPVSLYCIDAPAASELIWNNPPFLALVMNAVCARLRMLSTQITDIAFKDVSARVGQWLLNTTEKEGRREADGVHIQRNLSQAEFAALLGPGREVVWRALKRFQEEGLIKLERHEITVVEPERLADVVHR